MNKDECNFFRFLPYKIDFECDLYLCHIERNVLYININRNGTRKIKLFDTEEKTLDSGTFFNKVYSKGFRFYFTEEELD